VSILAAMSFCLSAGANNAPPNQLAGFEGPLVAGERGEKEKKGGGKQRKETDGNGGSKHPLPI